MRPRVEVNKVGTTQNWDNADAIDFSKVYVAHERDTVDTINKKLASGLHLVFQPGRYDLDAPIEIKNKNTVVMGIGQATLISTNGNAVIDVANVDGVRISGLLLQAGAKKSDTLLKWGHSQIKYAGDASNPGAMHDVNARVGGENCHGSMQTDKMVQINSGFVIIDGSWLWRADHDSCGEVYNLKNPVPNGLQVNGDNVTAYGLQVEHTTEDLVQWKGENGSTYFY